MTYLNGTAIAGSKGAHREASVRGLMLAGVLFLVSRWAVLPFPQPTSDVGLYARYAYEQAAAIQAGVPFFEFHAMAVKNGSDDGRPTGMRSTLLEDKEVEYPPLALAIMRVPSWAVTAPTTGWSPSARYVEQYRGWYRGTVAVADLILFLLLILLVRRLFPHESGRQQTRRLVTYITATMALWHLLYDRLDLLLALLLLLGLGMLVSRHHYLWSFAVAALQINFKLVPVVLVPIWILGSLTSSQLRQLMRPTGLLAAATRTAILLTMVAACFLPFFFLEGKHCLAFLTYHWARGLEIESIPATIPLVLHVLGQPLQLDYSFASINVQSPVTHALVKLTPWLVSALLLGALALLIAHLRQVADRDAGKDSGQARLAQLYPSVFSDYVLLFLSLFLLANKVFSPQYLLWLIPFVALLTLEPKPRRFFVWTFVTVCAVSTVLVPFLFWSDLIEQGTGQMDAFVVKAPTVRVTTLLIVRNMLFLGLTISLAIHLGKRALMPKPSSLR